MKILYLDCSMGAAGDMLTAALLELLPDREAFVAELNHLGIPGVRFEAEKSVKCGITGTHMSVTVDGESEDALHHHDHHHDEHHHHEEEHHHHHDEEEHHHHHHHSSMADVEAILGAMPVSASVRDRALGVYRRIAAAESAVHGVPVMDIHFHEVGTMDAIADVAAVCLLMERIGADRIVASPVHVGSGQVHCAHGILPVPAPATALILKDVPIYGGEIRGELCTPTGAALLTEFADEFGSMPVMRTDAIGYGMGKKDFPAANCVRAILGRDEEKTDTVAELSCNVDDMTGESIGYAMERFLEGGALDVYTVPIQMKKSRPGTLLRVMCRPGDRERMAELIFRHTTTIGIRELSYSRRVLSRRVTERPTPYGTVREKISEGYGVRRSKMEYDDLARIAQEQGLSLEDVRQMLK